jgi:hypothetical protein
VYVLKFTKDVKFGIQNQNPRIGTNTRSLEACAQTAQNNQTATKE